MTPISRKQIMQRKMENSFHKMFKIKLVIMIITNPTIMSIKIIINIRLRLKINSIINKIMSNKIKNLNKTKEIFMFK